MVKATNIINNIFRGIGRKDLSPMWDRIMGGETFYPLSEAQFSLRARAVEYTLKALKATKSENKEEVIENAGIAVKLLVQYNLSEMVRTQRHRIQPKKRSHWPKMAETRMKRRIDKILM